MTDRDEGTPFIDTASLGNDLCNTLGHVIIYAAGVIQQDPPDPELVHEALENVCEVAACVSALTKSCRTWDIYMDSGLENITKDTP